jgi:hypothetical protein
MNIVKLISNSSECNINQFIACAFSDDRSVLIISGKPSPKQLYEAWENILTEFNDISGQSASMEVLVLSRQILILEARITVFNNLIDVYEKAALTPGHPISDRGYALFRKYGYNVEFTGDRKAFLEQLNFVKQSELTYKGEHASLIEELEKLQNSKEQINSTLDEISFLRQIKNIEVFYKIQLDFEKYSVKRLAILMSDYRKLVERQEMENN